MRICAALVRLRGGVPLGSAKHAGVSLVSGMTGGIDRIASSVWADRVAGSRQQIYRDLPLYLHTPTHLHIYITPAHPHCHSFTAAFSFSLSTYLFS